MKFLNPILRMLLVLSFAACAVGEGNSSTAVQRSFVTLKHSTGSEFRVFVAEFTDATVAVLIVHDYFGISDATKQYVLRLGDLDTAWLPSISMEANQQRAMRKLRS